MARGDYIDGPYKVMKGKDLALLVVLGVVVLVGCGTPTTVMGNKPGDSLNPAMSPAMKNAKLHGHAKSAG